MFAAGIERFVVRASFRPLTTSVVRILKNPCAIELKTVVISEGCN